MPKVLLFLLAAFALVTLLSLATGHGGLFIFLVLVRIARAATWLRR